MGENPDNTVRPIFLDGVDVGSGDQFDDAVPIHAAKASLAASPLPAGARLGILHHRFPRFHWVRVHGPRGFPEIQQYAPHIRILHAQRTIQIPGVGDAALAAAGFIGRNARLQERIVQTLHLPGDDAVFHVDLPGASARAIHAVRAANHLVVLPAVAVKLFPTAQRGVALVLDPRENFVRFHRWPLFPITEFVYRPRGAAVRR